MDNVTDAVTAKARFDALNELREIDGAPPAPPAGQDSESTALVAGLTVLKADIETAIAKIYAGRRERPVSRHLKGIAKDGYALQLITRFTGSGLSDATMAGRVARSLAEQLVALLDELKSATRTGPLTS